MQRRDHHDWASESYVDEWVRRQQTEDPARAERFQLMCDLFPFARDAAVTVLDIGAGYGPVSAFILDEYPRATCIAQDGSEPMLHRAQTLVVKYGERFKPHRSDLFRKDWLPKEYAPFDAAVSSSCLHNLRDFTRIGQIYREIREHLRPGAVFLNLDLVNAPTAVANGTTGPFPAAVDQHLAALTAAGFKDVDCFWKDLQRALVGGYA